jgi:uncharacterized membrane protein
VLTGVVLAVYGQADQTGADPYGLFLGWALRILGWVLVGRQAGLWLLLVVMVNLTLILYREQVLYPREGLGEELSRILGPGVWLVVMLADFRLAQLVFALNAASLVAWEVLSARGVTSARGRWFPRVLATVALFTVVITTLVLIFAGAQGAAHRLDFAAPVWSILFGVVSIRYCLLRCRDLFMLAMTLLGGIVLLTALIARASDGGAEIALLVMLLGAGQGNRVMTGTGIGFLVVFAGAYFYGVDISLLMKSPTLLATGLVMLAGRWGLLVLWPQGEAADGA